MIDLDAIAADFLAAAKKGVADLVDQFVQGARAHLAGASCVCDHPQSLHAPGTNACTVSGCPCRAFVAVEDTGENR